MCGVPFLCFCCRNVGSYVLAVVSRYMGTGLGFAGQEFQSGRLAMEQWFCVWPVCLRVTPWIIHWMVMFESARRVFQQLSFRCGSELKTWHYTVDCFKGAICWLSGLYICWSFISSNVSAAVGSGVSLARPLVRTLCFSYSWLSGLRWFQFCSCFGGVFFPMHPFSCLWEIDIGSSSWPGKCCSIAWCLESWKGQFGWNGYTRLLLLLCMKTCDFVNGCTLVLCLCDPVYFFSWLCWVVTF
jgi:hypothetical protein